MEQFSTKLLMNMDIYFSKVNYNIQSNIYSWSRKNTDVKLISVNNDSLENIINQYSSEEDNSFVVDICNNNCHCISLFNKDFIKQFDHDFENLTKMTIDYVKSIYYKIFVESFDKNFIEKGVFNILSIKDALKKFKDDVWCECVSSIDFSYNTSFNFENANYQQFLIPLIVNKKYINQMVEPWNLNN